MEGTRLVWGGGLGKSKSLLQMIQISARFRLNFIQIPRPDGQKQLFLYKCCYVTNEFMLRYFKEYHESRGYNLLVYLWHRWTSCSRWSHLGEHFIQELQRTIEIYFDPAWCTRHCLASKGEKMNINIYQFEIIKTQWVQSLCMGPKGLKSMSLKSCQNNMGSLWEHLNRTLAGHHNITFSNP